MSNKVIAICLDAFDAATARRLMSEGKLQAFKRFADKSARFELEHGPNNTARYTGLTMEHFASGMKPETAHKWSVVGFKPDTYEATQSHATLKPFFADLNAKTVVLDSPYFDMEGHTNIQGVVGWGGHDCGVNTYCYPDNLLDEMNAKFPPPPSHAVLNTMVYSSEESTDKMADALIGSVKNRTDIAEWMFGERFTDWDVAVMCYGESHDAIEIFLHGIDPNHHMAKKPSAKHARRGLEGVYEEISNGIERLSERFPDAEIMVFTMHGMGHSDTDLMDMVLLPEFMYRYEFNKEMFRPREDWLDTHAPSLRPDENWENAITGQMTHAVDEQIRSFIPRVTRRAGQVVDKLTTRQEVVSHDEELPQSRPGADRVFGLKWMPAHHYSPYWPKMKAFALPAYFAAPIRVNLKGRESKGVVELADYHALLDDIERELRACRDIKTGDQVIKYLTRPGEDDPMNIADTQGDIMIIWEGSPIGFRHPKFGDIGPAPCRRMGGHSGGYGAMWLQSDGIAPGDYGLRSSFDVAPTVVDLMGLVRPNYMDGESVLHSARSMQPAE